MAASLSSDELELVGRLEKSGYPRTAAVVAVAMVTREHARPESELVDILRQYQGLECREKIVSAIAMLKERKWLEEYEAYGLTLLRQAKDLRDKIAIQVGGARIKRQLSDLRAVNDPVVRVIGSMTDEDAYQTYLERLRCAKSEICMPMLATTSQLQAASIVKERAQAGVKVRLLLASRDVVCRLRGNTMGQMSDDAHAGWMIHAEDSPNIELRVTSQVADARLASCALIDGSILRMDIYDPARQRSLQGTLIEVDSGDEFDLNIVSLFRDAFDDAWDNASPTGALRKCLHESRKHWQWVVFALMLGIALATFPASPVLSGMFASAAASFFVIAIVNSWSFIVVAVRKALRHD